MEPFSMKEEREMGKINKDGYFVFNKEKENEFRDPWLDSLDEQQDPYSKLTKIASAHHVEKSLDAIRAQHTVEEDPNIKLTDKEVDFLKKELCDMLLDGIPYSLV